MAENARERDEGEERDECGRVNNFRIVARDRGRQNMENTPHCGIGAKGHIDGQGQGDTWTDGRRQGQGQGRTWAGGNGCGYAYMYTFTTVIEKPVSRFPPLSFFFPSFPLFPLVSCEP